jgi:LPXTG-site transpeptidase (sortase) family protein
VLHHGAGDRLAGLSKRLFVLFLAMVIAGFALPSPGIAARPEVPGQPYVSNYAPLAKPSSPLLLIVPEIHLRAPIIPIPIVVTSDGTRTLTPPNDYHEVGWWDQSAPIGSPSGQTLLTGHTVHTGGGVMNLLGDLRPGALVRIRTKLGVVDYRATDVFVFTKQELSDNAEELFGQKRHLNRLVLVTCTGWTGSYYTSNIIVFADPLGVRKKSAGPVDPYDAS